MSPDFSSVHKRKKKLKKKINNNNIQDKTKRGQDGRSIANAPLSFLRPRNRLDEQISLIGCFKKREFSNSKVTAGMKVRFSVSATIFALKPETKRQTIDVPVLCFVTQRLLFTIFGFLA